MTDLRSPVQIALQDAGYQTWLAPMGGDTVIVFEDDAVMGFVCMFDDVVSMLQRWQEMERDLLAANAPALHRGGDKTWNVYCVFLCSAALDETRAREVRWIEENLERTRKIAACNVQSREQIKNAILPLLPIQFQPVLDSEEFDLTHRLKRRIADIAPAVSDSVLNEGVPASEVARILGAQS